MSDFDWDEFEAAIRLLKSGVDKLPFRDVIKAATGHNILPFNDSTRAVVRKLDEWISVNVQHLSNHIESEYIGRPNELGNYLERILLNDFQRDLAPSIRCEMPRTISGHAQAVGYPDGVIFTQNEVMYFDVKIYQNQRYYPSFILLPTHKSEQDTSRRSAFSNRIRSRIN